MKIATRTFKFTDAYGSGEVVKGERVDDRHELVPMFPNCWRTFELADELRVRSDRVAELREQATRPASAAPLSRAGREEREEERFWAQVDRDLYRDTRSAEERAEERIFEEGLAQMEAVDAARLRDLTADFREAWGGRLPADD